MSCWWDIATGLLKSLNRCVFGWQGTCKSIQKQQTLPWKFGRKQECIINKEKIQMAFKYLKMYYLNILIVFICLSCLKKWKLRVLIVLSNGEGGGWRHFHILAVSVYWYACMLKHAGICTRMLKKVGVFWHSKYKSRNLSWGSNRCVKVFA